MDFFPLALAVMAAIFAGAAYDASRKVGNEVARLRKQVAELAQAVGDSEGRGNQ